MRPRVNLNAGHSGSRKRPGRKRKEYLNSLRTSVLTTPVQLSAYLFLAVPNFLENMIKAIVHTHMHSELAYIYIKLGKQHQNS